MDGLAVVCSPSFRRKISSILSFTSKPFLAKSKGLRFPGKGMRFKTSNFEKGIVSGFILNFDEASA